MKLATGPPKKNEPPRRCLPGDLGLAFLLLEDHLWIKGPKELLPFSSIRCDFLFSKSA
jgi:hypothetical protein